MQIIDRIKERVRLAEGMDGSADMSPEASGARAGLPRLFAERLTNIKPDQIRIAGTYTLRRASNAREFVREAAKVLNQPHRDHPSAAGRGPPHLSGSPIPSTSGPGAGGGQIDGGSTELIIGEGLNTRRSPVVKMGCVSFTQTSLQRQAEREALQRRRVGGPAPARPHHQPVPVSGLAELPRQLRLHPHGTRCCWGKRVD